MLSNILFKINISHKYLCTNVYQCSTLTPRSHVAIYPSSFVQSKETVRHSCNRVSNKLGWKDTHVRKRGGALVRLDRCATSIAHARHSCQPRIRISRKRWKNCELSEEYIALPSGAPRGIDGRVSARFPRVPVIQRRGHYVN